jgi:hypothetical protein
MLRSYRTSLSESVEPQASRRLWVVLVYGGWAAMIALWSISRQLDGELALGLVALAAVAALAALVGYGRLMARNTINAANVANDLLDERLIQIRDAAMRNAYRTLYVIGTFAGAALFVLILVNPLGCEKTFTANRMFFAFTALFSAVLIPLVLPTTLVAWTSPDPPSDADTV